MNAYIGMVLVVVAFVLGAAVGYYFGSVQPAEEDLLEPTPTAILFSPTTTPRPLFTPSPSPLLSPTLSPLASPLGSPSPSPLTSPRTSPLPGSPQLTP